MNGAYMAVAAASLTAGAAVFYAHYNQITERAVSIEYGGIKYRF